MSIGEKPPKLDQEIKKKIRSLIDEKPLKLNKESQSFIAL